MPISKPHRYRSDSEEALPFFFRTPDNRLIRTLDRRGIPTRLLKAVSLHVPKDKEDCYICLENIHCKQRGAIASPCCDHFVHILCIKRWNVLIFVVFWPSL